VSRRFFGCGGKKNVMIFESHYIITIIIKIWYTSTGDLGRHDPAFLRYM